MKRQAKVVKNYKRSDLEIWLEDNTKTAVAWSVVKLDQSIKLGRGTLRGARAGWAEGMKQIKK